MVLFFFFFFFLRNESLAKQGQVLVIKSQSYNIKVTMSNVHKMVKHTLRILQLMLSRVFHYFLDTRHDRIGALNDAKKFEVGRRMRSFCFVFLVFFCFKVPENILPLYLRTWMYYMLTNNACCEKKLLCLVLFCLISIASMYKCNY